jgi:hypothetical protein
MRRVLRGWSVVALLLVAVSLAACGSSSSWNESTAKPSATKVSYSGAENKNPSPAPPLRLRDSLGENVDIRDFHT